MLLVAQAVTQLRVYVCLVESHSHDCLTCPSAQDLEGQAMRQSRSQAMVCWLYQQTRTRAEPQGPTSPSSPEQASRARAAASAAEIRVSGMAAIIPSVAAGKTP